MASAWGIKSRRLLQNRRACALPCLRPAGTARMHTASRQPHRPSRVEHEPQRPVPSRLCRPVLKVNQTSTDSISPSGAGGARPRRGNAPRPGDRRGFPPRSKCPQSIQRTRGDGVPLGRTSSLILTNPDGCSPPGVARPSPEPDVDGSSGGPGGWAPPLRRKRPQRWRRRREPSSAPGWRSVWQRQEQPTIEVEWCRPGMSRPGARTHRDDWLAAAGATQPNPQVAPGPLADTRRPRLRLQDVGPLRPRGVLKQCGRGPLQAPNHLPVCKLLLITRQAKRCCEGFE